MKISPAIDNQATAQPLRSGRMVSVRLRLSRDNMEYLQGIVEMYLESEEPRFRRIAKTVARTIEKELSKTEPHANTGDVPRPLGTNSRKET